MRPKLLVALALLIAAFVVGWRYLRGSDSPVHYTGFVEGEERIIRSEVAARVLEIPFAEGAAVTPEAVVAVLDDLDIKARINSKHEELSVIDAEWRTQEEKIALIESTWKRDVGVRGADLRQAEIAAELASKTLAREKELIKSGASTAQLLDDSRASRQQADSGLERARQMLARTEAEERQIRVARNELETLKQRRALAHSQLEELLVAQAKYRIQAPATGTVVQTQFIWPGELAQPGAAVVALLDPKDKYVQIYVPVVDVGRLRVGQRVEIELDSEPGRRVPGEVSFIADKANFTPEKIETRSDRMGQVYRAKVRILEGVERFQPGTEGNVYLDTPAG